MQQGASSIGASVVDMIDYRATDGLVVVATHSSGIFASHITDVSDVSVPSITSNNVDFNLVNYPNPFNSQTNIQFNLMRRDHVSVFIYDAMGKLVHTLANETMDAGEKKYTFSALGLASGIYYCTVRVGQTAETKSMLLRN